MKEIIETVFFGLAFVVLAALISTQARAEPEYSYYLGAWSATVDDGNKYVETHDLVGFERCDPEALYGLCYGASYYTNHLGEDTVATSTHKRMPVTDHIEVGVGVYAATGYGPEVVVGAAPEALLKHKWAGIRVMAMPKVGAVPSFISVGFRFSVDGL